MQVKRNLRKENEFKSQVYPCKLKIFADFITNINVFSFIGHLVSEIDTLVSDLKFWNLINWSLGGQIKKLQI